MHNQRREMDRKQVGNRWQEAQEGTGGINEDDARGEPTSA